MDDRPSSLPPIQTAPMQPVVSATPSSAADSTQSGTTVSSNQPSPGHTSQTEGSNGGAQKSVIDTVSTATMAVFTAMVGWYTKRLYEVGKDQKAILDQQRKISEKDSEHNRVVERAYVTVSHYMPVNGARTIMWPGEGGFAGPKPAITLRVANFGNTPSTVTDFGMIAHTLAKNYQLPSSPPEIRSIGAGTYLVKGDSFNHYGVLNLAESSITDIRSGELQLWLLAYVDYIDAFNEHWRTGYARRYLHHVDQPGLDSLFVEPKKGYNYNRIRQRGEGMDWDI
jgi:hypothetical protein